MRQVWEMWGGVLTVWALAVPVLVAGIRVVLWLRRGQPRAVALRNTLAEAGILVGTVPWIWMILTPTGGERGVSLLPLRDLFDTLGDGPEQAVVQVGANMIVFLPLGLLLPLRLPRFAGVGRMFLVGAALSALLEIAQYALDLGRVSSVDDVLMNASGAAIGAALTGTVYKIAVRAQLMRKTGPRGRNGREAPAGIR
ncbi:VanZ family protein [Nocardia sp. NPDC052001]|uniref:VanZ family protein n=1 Tax=Nocardia sp. NPDC052001 TaxID=3154853 RepID=UPI00341C2EE0